MKKFLVAMVFVSGCASMLNTKPCVGVAPPQLTKMECQQVEVAEGYLGLICKEESVSKFNTFVGDSEKWMDQTWKSCGPKK